MTRQVQLIMVTENNNNKFYNMTEEGSQIRIEYGRVGAAVRTCYKSISQWDKIYREKTGKGYKDITSLKSELKIKSDYKQIENIETRYIVDLLLSRSRQCIANNYRVSYTEVTQIQIDEAQRIIDELTTMQSSTAISNWFNDFNKSLLKLYTVIPRKMTHVNDHLMQINASYEDFQRKICKEQDLLDTMATQVNQNKVLENNTGKDITILEANNIEIVPVVEAADLEIIKYKLGDNANQFVQAWKVVNKNTQERFNSNRSSLIDPVIRTHLLWHGSRTENWWSIISNGLIIRPSNAVYTGSMFGDGLYFASKAQKSIGYTSLSSSYWARGNDNKAYLALYDVQTGKQYHIEKHTSECYSLNKKTVNEKGYDSVFAHKGADLRNDEFIVYDSAQATITYLVEIKR